MFSSTLTAMLRRLRFVTVLFVLVMVTAAPALTCLSFMQEMNMAQMACCRQMNDDCDMGVGDQSCCGHDNSQVLRATLHSKVVHIQPFVVATTMPAATVQDIQTRHSALIHADDVSPPPAARDSNNVLRI